jgi:hypothetical protein
VRPGSSRPVAIELRDRQPLNPREFRIVDKRTAEVLSACYPTLIVRHRRHQEPDALRPAGSGGMEERSCPAGTVWRHRGAPLPGHVVMTEPKGNEFCVEP